jgi:hypothetical protein
MGSGYRTFTAGEVLTASNVQNYLQDQAVMVFGGTAARSSAIGTANFEEGMLTYLTDVDKLQVYTGSSFQDVYPAVASTQGLTFISSTTVGSGVSSISLAASTFTSTFDSYRVIFDWTRTTAVSGSQGDVQFRFRTGATDSSSGYNYNGWSATGSLGLSSVGGGTEQFIGKYLSATPTRFSTVMDIHGVAQAQETKYHILNVGMNGGTNQSYGWNGWHLTATAYDSMTFILTGGTMTNGRIFVYGYNS